MKKFSIALLLVALAVGLVVGGAAARSAKSTATTADMCVLLPDPKSSKRWETNDRPGFIAAFTKAGVSYVITNADGDAQKQRSQADQCLANGAKVVILVSLDAGSSLAIERAAVAKGAKVIEYDRQVGKGSPASIYISLDGKAVGVLQGKGVVAGLKANGMYSKKPVVAELNGGQTDNNSFLFKSGYDSVLKPLYANGTFKKGPDQFVPGWDNQKARTIFEQMLVRTGNKIDAVAAANDGLAGAVVAALKAKKLKPIPLSGQDATAQGVQNISGRLADDDRLEGSAGWSNQSRRRRRSRSSKGQTPKTTGTVPNGSKKLPAYIIKPISITKANYTDPLQGLPEEERGLPR